MPHSPGPWKMCQTDTGFAVGPGPVSATWTWLIENLSEDDARLIAAAPELLAALRTRVNRLCGCASCAGDVALVARIDGGGPGGNQK